MKDDFWHIPEPAGRGYYRAKVTLYSRKQIRSGKTLLTSFLFPC